MAAQKPSIPKGTRDFGSEQMQKRQFIFQNIRSVFEKYGFQPLETPTMENLSVLTGKYGDEGKPIVESNPEHEISKIYLNFAKQIKSIYLGD